MALIQRLIGKSIIKKIEEYIELLNEAGDEIDKSLDKKAADLIVQIPWDVILIAILNKLLDLLKRVLGMKKKE